MWFSVFCYGVRSGFRCVVSVVSGFQCAVSGFWCSVAVL